jgi:hypothetical protein
MAKLLANIRKIPRMDLKDKEHDSWRGTPPTRIPLRAFCDITVTASSHEE